MYFKSTILCFFVALTSALHGMSVDPVMKEYVQPWQIVLQSEGMFYKNDIGHVEQLDDLFCDNNGIYILKYFQCPGCGRWNLSERCVNEDCPLYLQ